MTALLLIAVFGLVLINAFFVIAEYSLVRSRRPKLEASEKRDCAARARAGPAGQHQRVHLGLPGRDHADLDRHRRRRRARVASLLEPVLGGAARARRGGRHLGDRRLPADHQRPHHVGELVPKLSRSSTRRLVRLVARPLRVSRRVRPVHHRLTFVSNRILRLLGVDPDTINEQAENPEELKLIITESLQGGQLDPGEAGCCAASSTCTSRRRAR